MNPLWAKGKIIKDAIHKRVMARYSKSALEKKFRKLVKEWWEGTCILSNPTQIVSHPAYKRIVAMGNKIIPLILKEYQTGGSFEWCAVLEEITGENPVQSHHAVSYNLMRDDWLSWGGREGYIVYDKISIELRKFYF